MCWLKRGLWISAWGVWFVLGIGLHRELPRDLGPVVCELPLDDLEWPHGLIGDELAVTKLRSDEKTSERRRVWDVKSHRLLYEVKTPGGLEWESTRWGFAIGLNIKSWTIKPGQKALQLLNYRTGEWTPLGMKDWSIRGNHESKPWIIIDATFDDDLDSPKDGGRRPLRLFVFDVETKQTVFSWVCDEKLVDPATGVTNVWFHGDELAIIVGRYDMKAQSYASMRIERWQVPSKSRLSTAPIDPPDRYVIPSANGGRMILQARPRTKPGTDVVDAVTLERLFSAGDLDEGRVELVGHFPSPRLPRLSASGRALLTGFGNLWSVERQREIWKRDPVTEFVRTGESSTTFQVLEDWSKRLPELEVFQNRSTIATRDFDTGRLLVRRWADPQLYAVSESGRTAFAREDVIYQMPALVNYPLLALCQTILALPLLLLWVVLRWRRKRRLRLASVAA